MFTKADASSIQLAGFIRKHTGSIELLSQFRNENLWMSEENSARGTLGLLGLHTNKYFSPFRAAFLFEIKSLSAMSYFSPILVRDGALTLLKFFYDNPQPPNNTLLLIISDRLKNIIPANWVDNVVTYKLTSNKKFNYSHDKIKILFLNTQLGPNQCTLKYVSDFYTQLHSRTQKASFEIYFSSFLSYNAEDLQVRNELAKHDNELLAEVMNIFKSVPIIKSPRELTSDDFSDFLFCDLNEFSFYYSDSCFYHSLLCHGAIGFFNNSAGPAALLETPLSPYHKIEIFELQKVGKDLSQSQDVQNHLDEYRKSKALNDEAAQHKPETICFAHKICCPSFEDMAYNLIKNYPPALPISSSLNVI